MMEAVARLLIMVTVVVALEQQDQMPQLCLNGTAGGLECRCSMSLTDLALRQWEVDCSSRNISGLPENWTISQMAYGLDLSRNRLSFLRSGQFSLWGNLEKLILSRNKFASLNEDVFVGLSSLVNLDLSFNSLATLPPKIFNGLTILTILNLENNRLQELSPNVFSSTPHLDTLKLSYNTALGKYLMKSPEFLTSILQKNLTSLALNNMSIDTIPENCFNEAGHLHHLSLADNPLHIIDYLPATLEGLNLSGINVTTLRAGSFVSYPKLKRLQLDRLTNLLEVEINAFEGLESLEILTMENCVQLHFIDEEAFGSVSIPLRKVSLARGGLHSLQVGTFMPLEATLEHLDLQGNPWECDCNLAWLRELNFSLEDSGYLRCFSPAELHNKLLLSVDPNDFVCTHSPAARTYSGLVVVLDVFLVLVVLTVAGVILMVLWRRGRLPCAPRATVGRYSHVTIEPNRAELEWDDKDLDHIWSTPNSTRQNVPRGP